MKRIDHIGVLGAGNTGFAAAAQLTHRGYKVTLAELPAFADALDPIRSDGVIHLFGVGHQGPAKLHCVTDDVAVALDNSNVLLLIVPAYGHAAWARAIAPHIRPDHTLTLMPGTLGALEVVKILRDARAPAVSIAETDTAPYVCRKTQPDGATIWGVVPSMGLGVFPSSETNRVHGQLAHLFPGIVAVDNVAACGLNSMNPVVHPAGVLLNAGRIEASRGEFYFYDEGVTPGVVRVIEALDAERRAIGAAFGFDLPDVATAFARAGFGPQGDLWSTINGSRMLTALRAPGSLDTRWLSEDVPYGLGIWSKLGDMLGVDTPVMDSLIQLGLVILGEPPNAIRRRPSDVGLQGMSRDEMLAYVTTGSRS